MELNQLYTLVINVLVVMAFILPVRFILAKHLSVHAKSELDKTDNAAFGVAIAGGVLGLIFMLTGVMSGDSMAVLSEEILSLVIYGILGSILMIVGVLVQDLIVIRRVSLAEEVRNGNMAAAIVIAINMAVVGLVAKQTITWVDSEGLTGLLPVVVVFVISQVVLAIVALIRMCVYSLRNSKNSTNGIDAADTWQGAIKAGNCAVAVRYAGQLLATGIVLSATSFVVDTEYSLSMIALTWGATALALVFSVWVAYRLFLPLVLFKINIVEEVDQQNNLGVASVEAALFIGLAAMASAYIV